MSQAGVGFLLRGWGLRGEGDVKSAGFEIRHVDQRLWALPQAPRPLFSCLNIDGKNPNI